MVPARRYRKLLVVTAILLQGIFATETHVPCVHDTRRPLALDELVHFSDVIVTGRVLTSTTREDEFRTFSTTISYYYAYKADSLLPRRALASVTVSGFDERPGGVVAVFFLVRRQNMELSIYCMSEDSELYGIYGSSVMIKVKNISDADNMKNEQFESPYPNPCDSEDTNTCSPVGSHCTVKNTPRDETFRCVCKSGFYGDGFNCTARTREALLKECNQCYYGARCSESKDNIASGDEWQDDTRVLCTCNHFKCLDIDKTPKQWVCGTDGVTYDNVCLMKKQACLQQKDIHVLHKGLCKPKSVIHCGGMDAPLSTTAGLVLCAKKSCPQMHFCHSSDTFAVCCPVHASISTTAATESIPLTDNKADLPLPTVGSGSGSGSGELEWNFDGEDCRVIGGCKQNR